MSHSALLFVIQSMCHVSLYISLCCFYTDRFSSCFSLCLLSFQVFGHPVVLSSVTDDSLFILPHSPTEQSHFTYYSAHFREDYQESQKWGPVQSIVQKLLTSDYHQGLVSEKIQVPAPEIWETMRTLGSTGQSLLILSQYGH